MEPKVYINGKLYPKDEAKISVFDHGLLYGGEDIMGAGYSGDNFSAGVNKKEGSKPEFRLGFKKKFAKGGKAWQPKSAPKLTTTIPPERGPTPHGLTYLTGDDIVKHRIG